MDRGVEGHTELTDTHHYVDHYQVELNHAFSVLWRNAKRICSMQPNGLFSIWGEKKKKVIMELHKIQVRSRLFEKLCDLESYGGSKGLNEWATASKMQPE